MELIIALICVLAVLIALRWLFHTSTEKIKMLAKNEKLNELTNKFPENKVICKKILALIGNKTTKIEEDDKSNTCLYLVMTDKILIANLRDNFTRIQTIAHECIHSMQDKKNLWFNFIFSNIFLLYFVLITILTVVGIVNNPMLHLFILAIAGFLNYAIRSQLESDAMIKARYLARNYMYTEKILEPKEIEEIASNYDVLNKIGVPVVNYNVAFGILLKVVIYAIVAVVVQGM